MTKIIDKNSFWFIPHNPISKVGIFDYLGSSISDECEPNKIYKVFRSGETLLNSVPTWDNPPKPFINDHEMLGEGFTEVDDRPVQGVITNPQYEDGVLYADITVYSEKLKEAIENGKKELSLGYFCKFEKQPGVYDGEPYDFVQVNMVGNHIALVDAGRCGSDIKVFDQKCVMDSFDIVAGDQLKKIDETAIIETEKEKETATKDETMADKREYIRKIMAIAAKPDSDFEGGEEEKVETIAKLLENSEYAKSENKKSEDEAEKEEKAEDKCGKDEDSEKKTEDESEKEESKEKEKAEDEDVKASDVMAFLNIILEEVRKIGEKKVADESEEKKGTEDESEEKESEKSEDEDEKSEDEDKEEEKKAGDGVLFTFGQDKAIDGEDPAIKAYLA